MGKTKKAAKALAKADRAVTHKAARHRETPVAKVTGFLAEIADQPQLIATSIGTLVIGLVARRPDLARGGARMLAAHLTATAMKAAIKHSIDRTRPETALAKGRARFERGDSHDHEQNSFPSGHTAGAVAVARAASRDIDGIAAPAGIATGAIAAVQPVTGKHYLTDLAAGAAIGWIAEALVSALFDRLLPEAEDGGRDGSPRDPATAHRESEAPQGT